MILHDKSPALVTQRGQGFLKKIALIMLLILSLSDATAYAADYTPGLIATRTNYLKWKDEYRVDYSKPGPSYNVKYFRVKFVADSGLIYETDYDFWTGIMFLTCNGVYQFQYLDADFNVRLESRPITTTKIKNPPCLSYPDGGQKNDLDATYTENADGTFTLHWNRLPGAVKYEIYLNGDLVGTVTDSGDSFDLPHSGAVNIVAKDDNDDYLGHSDLQVPEFDGSPGWGNNNTCNICDIISDVLECPGWDDYMGAWRDMIADLIPPPPDWDEVASKISNAMIDALDDWMGDMPETPSRQDLFDRIDTDLPNVDTSIEDVADLVPDMPSDYDDPFEFDITDGEQIEIVDDSEPFDIFDPLHDYDHDQPGDMVFPNDPRNHSDGIKEPDRITTDAPEPTPTAPPQGEVPAEPIPTLPDDPGVPPAIIPIPERPDAPDMPIP